MSKLLSIVALTLLVITAALAQGPPAAPFVSWPQFGGIVDVDPNSVPLGQALDMMNFDIIQTGASLGLEKRRGFVRLGSAFSETQVNGVFQYSNSDGQRRLIAVAGRSIYEYDAQLNSFVRASLASIVSTCNTINGSATITGTGTKWWEVSGYDIDSIAIEGDTGSVHLGVRHILSDTVIIAGAAWPTTSASAAACTLLVSVPDEVLEQFSIGGEMYGNMLLDTLVIAGPNERVRYAPRFLGTVESPMADSVASAMIYQSGIGMAKIYGIGPLSGQASRWYQICRLDRPGNRWRNVALYWYTGGPDEGWFVADTNIFNFLDDGEIKVHQLTNEQDDFDSLLFKATVSTFRCDTINTLFGSQYGLQYRIRTTSVAGSPGSWPLDSLSSKTVVVRGTDWVRYGTVDVPCWEVDSGGSSELCFTLYGAGLPISDPPFQGGDSIYLFAQNFGYESLGGGDSIQVDTSWAWPVQFMFTPQRLGYFGNTSTDWGPSYIMVLKGLEITRDSVDQYFGVAVDDGRPILAAINVGSYVYVHKGGQEVYQVELSDIGKGGIITTTNTGTSAVSQDGVGQWHGAMVFVSPTGFYAGVGSSLIRLSQSIDNYWRDSIPDQAMPYVKLAVIGDQARISYPSSGSVNSRTLIYDFVTQQWTKHSYGMGKWCMLESGQSEDTLVFGSPRGTGDGNVCLFGRQPSDTGVVSNCYYKTGYFPIENTNALYSLEEYSVTRWSGYRDTLTFTAWNDFGASSVSSSNISDLSGGWNTVNRYVGCSRIGAVWQFQLGSTTGADSLKVISMGLKFANRSARPRR